MYRSYVDIETDTQAENVSSVRPANCAVISVDKNPAHSAEWPSHLSQIATGPLVWVLLLGILAWRWRFHLDRILDAFADRIEAGDDLDLGVVKISVREGFSSIPVSKKPLDME